MFSDEEVKKKATIEVGPLLIALQLVARLQEECRRMNGSPAVSEHEMGLVGIARNNMVVAVEEATGKNYDVVREAQIRQMQQQMQEPPPPEVPEENSKKPKKKG